MRWRGNEGWYAGFAWWPVQLSDGTWVWLESFRFYVNRCGTIPTILPKEK